MKIIDVPAPVKCPVKIRDEKGDVADSERQMTFKEYLTAVCKSYDVFAKGVENGRTYGKIMAIIEALGGHETVQFEDEHFKILKAAAEAQQWASPDINRIVSNGFFPAIENAQDVKAPVERKNP